MPTANTKSFKFIVPAFVSLEAVRLKVNSLSPIFFTATGQPLFAGYI